jgi:myo-inositol-1(or 4)-monophosphatase
MKFFAINTAKEAGKIIMEYFHKDKGERPKAQHDMVTVVDKKVEHLITARIKEKFPAHNYIGEEFGSSKIKSDYTWYIDPLDGTMNYLMGVPLFCVSLGLTYKSDPVLAVVYNPYTKELFTAEKGKGAFLNDIKISVSQTKELDKAMLVTGYFLRKDTLDFFKTYKKLMLAAHTTRNLGSCVMALCYVAAGRVDAFVKNNANPWDTVAGAIILEEAGGKLTDFSGNEWNPFMKNMVASNGKIHSQLLNVIR